MKRPHLWHEAVVGLPAYLEKQREETAKKTAAALKQHETEREEMEKKHAMRMAKIRQGSGMVKPLPKLATVSAGE